MASQYYYCNFSFDGIMELAIIRGQYLERGEMRKYSQNGQGLTEYAMILSLMAVAVIAVLAVMGPAVGNIFSNVVNTLDQRAETEPQEPPEENLTVGASALRLGFEHSNDVLVTVNVSATTSVTITDSQAAKRHYRLQHRLPGDANRCRAKRRYGQRDRRRGRQRVRGLCARP
jgi:pilus assembly protein Flp/PilA